MEEPTARECVICYVARMVETHGCDGSLKWAQHFRELRSPTATGLERRLGAVGASCDCEVLLTGWTLARELLVRDVHTDELEQPAEPPDCAGVGSTSTRPCVNWTRPPRA